MKFIVGTRCRKARLWLSDQQAGWADGIDVGILRVEVQDKDGYVVPTADSWIRCGVVGPRKATGRGEREPERSDPGQEPQHSMASRQRQAWLGKWKCIYPAQG